MSHITRYDDQPNPRDSYLRKDNFEWDAETIYDSRIESMTWLNRYLEVHSAQALNDLFRFIEDYELSDLRRICAAIISALASNIAALSLWTA